ncbi:MAG: hypothetical protein LIP01_14135 [Tannerellaceae bacterium]|nr:hypothetical protein [Tannerellaceae bacterium]
MKTMNLKRVKLLTLVMLMSIPAFAHRMEFEIIPSADFVSRYVWRGTDCGPTSIQPAITAAYKGLSLELWGSTDFTTPVKEIDITLGYEINGLNLALVDYWIKEYDGFRYGDFSNNHAFEASIGYYFGDSAPLTLTWSTMFAGGADKKENDKQAYSTFIEANYDFSVKNVDLSAGIGVSPWKSAMYHRPGTSGFALCTVSLKASKAIRITDSFSLPVFVEGIFAPNQDDVFLVFGISL